MSGPKKHYHSYRSQNTDPRIGVWLSLSPRRTNLCRTIALMIDGAACMR